jgi:hydrogenase maturation factor
VPACKKKTDHRQFKVGDKILVNLHHGRIEDAAIIEHTSRKKLQVDFGKDMTAPIDTWQVVDD